MFAVAFPNHNFSVKCTDLLHIQRIHRVVDQQKQAVCLLLCTLRGPEAETFLNLSSTVAFASQGNFILSRSNLRLTMRILEGPGQDTQNLLALSALLTWTFGNTCFYNPLKRYPCPTALSIHEDLGFQSPELCVFSRFGLNVHAMQLWCAGL